MEQTLRIFVTDGGTIAIIRNGKLEHFLSNMVITIFCSWNLQKPQSIVKKRLDIDLMDGASKHVGNTIFQKACESERKAQNKT